MLPNAINPSILQAKYHVRSVKSSRIPQTSAVQAYNLHTLNSHVDCLINKITTYAGDGSLEASKSRGLHVDVIEDLEKSMLRKVGRQFLKLFRGCIDQDLLDKNFATAP